MQSIKVLIYFIIGIILSIVLLLGIASLCFALILGIKTGLAWNELDRFESERATQWYVENPPLDLETITYLCETYDIPKDDSLCNGSKTIYAPNFFKVIIRAYKIGVTPYHTIDKDLGRYEYERTSPVKIHDGTILYGVRYDLKGDRASELIFTFNGDKILINVATRVGEPAP